MPCHYAAALLLLPICLPVAAAMLMLMLFQLLTLRHAAVDILYGIFSSHADMPLRRC